MAGFIDGNDKHRHRRLLDDFPSKFLHHLIHAFRAETISAFIRRKDELA
jgi:hypothetical protein